MRRLRIIPEAEPTKYCEATMASFWDALTAPFTGASAEKANALQNQSLTNSLNTARQDLATAGSTANTNINQALQNASSFLNQGYQGATGAINPAYSTASNLILSAPGAAAPYYEQALGAYAPLRAIGQQYQPAIETALASMGIGTPEQIAAARNAFTTSPGYDFQLNQGLEAINRASNKAGGLGGNTGRAAQTYGTGLAANEYNTWLSNLLGLVNPQIAATGAGASGQAGIFGQQAGLAAQTPLTLANLEQNRGNLLAQLAQQYGAQQAGNVTNAGQLLANIAQNTAQGQAGATQNFAQPIASTYKDTTGQAGANIWNAIFGAGQLAARFINPLSGLTGSSGLGPVAYSGYNTTGLPGA